MRGSKCFEALVSSQTVGSRSHLVSLDVFFLVHLVFWLMFVGSLVLVEDIQFFVKTT